MGAKVSETLLSGSMLEIDVRNIAEDIAASTVPLVEWKPLMQGQDNQSNTSDSEASLEIRL